MASLDQIRKHWEEAYNRGNLSAILELYAEDARYYTSDGKVDEGRQAIAKARQKEYDEIARALGGRPFKTKIVKHERMEFSDTALEIGGFTASSDGQVVNQGFYMAVARKIDGEWQLVRHMTTSVQPTSEQQESQLAGMA
ncbi:MAG: SgcJ/EcaC family oxidoreductase [Deinococcales bacterium]